MAAQLKVADEQFNSDGIRRLYESVEYPLARRGGKASSVSRGIEIGSHDQGKRRFQATCLEREIELTDQVSHDKELCAF